MLGHNFRNDTIKKYIAVFGSLFNDIQIERFDVDENVWQQLKIPLSYGPRDKLIDAAHKDFGSTQQAVSLNTPRMAFVLDDYSYDTTRKTNTMDKVKLSSTKHMYNSVPYRFDFTVYVAAKTQTDGNRIVEQILPFFTPSIAITIHPIPDNPTYKKDIKVVFTSVRCEDQYEGDSNERRSIVWELRFTLQGFLFGPTTTTSIIKRVEVNFRGDQGYTNVVERILIHPGLTTGGLPTTNPLLSVPYQQVNKDDNWDFITEYDHGS